MTNRLMNMAAKNDPKPRAAHRCCHHEMGWCRVHGQHDDGEDHHADDLEEDTGVLMTETTLTL